MSGSAAAPQSFSKRKITPRADSGRPYDWEKMAGRYTLSGICTAVNGNASAEKATSRPRLRADMEDRLRGARAPGYSSFSQRTKRDSGRNPSCGSPATICMARPSSTMRCTPAEASASRSPVLRGAG